MLGLGGNLPGTTVRYTLLMEQDLALSVSPLLARERAEGVFAAGLTRRPVLSGSITASDGEMARLDSRIPVREVLTCQRVERIATRMCHAIELPCIALSDAERAHTPIGKH